MSESPVFSFSSGMMVVAQVRRQGRISRDMNHREALQEG